MLGKIIKENALAYLELKQKELADI